MADERARAELLRVAARRAAALRVRDRDDLREGAQRLGFGHIVALYYRSSTLYHIHERIRYLYF